MTKKLLALAVATAMVAITLVIAACGGGVEDYIADTEPPENTWEWDSDKEAYLIPPQFEIYDTIVVNDVIIDAPAPIWLHALEGWRGVDGELPRRLIPLIMVPLRPVAEALGWSVDWSEENQEIWVDNVRLRIGENEGFSPEQEWRDGMFHLAAAPTIIDGEIFVPASFFPAQVFERQLIIGGYWLSRIDDFVIGVAPATEERLGNYNSYIWFDEPEREHLPRYIISPSVPLRDVRWLRLGWGSADGEQYRYGIEIFSAGDVTPKHPLVVTYVHPGSFSNRGFSFVDKNGATRYFVVQDNQADFEESPRGWLIIFEFTPFASPW